MNRTLIIGLVLISVSFVGLGAQEPMNLGNLVQRGDIYLTPETLVLVLWSRIFFVPFRLYSDQRAGHTKGWYVGGSI